MNQTRNHLGIGLLIAMLCVVTGGLLWLNQNSQDHGVAAHGQQDTDRSPVVTPAAHGNMSAQSSGISSVGTHPSGGQGADVEKRPDNDSATETEAAMHELEVKRFQNHGALVKARHEVWDFQKRLTGGNIPAESSDLFKSWAKLLYRDSLLVGVARADAGNPVKQELFDALTVEGDPQIAWIQKANLGKIPEARLTKLLTKIAELPANPDFHEAVWITSELELLLKKAKDRSDTHYMSVMRGLLKDPQATMEARVAYTNRFIEIGDVTMAFYALEYYEGTLGQNVLSPDDTSRVEQVVANIKELRKR